MNHLPASVLARRASTGLFVAAVLLVIWASGQFFRGSAAELVAPPAVAAASATSAAPTPPVAAAGVPTDAELLRAIATDLFSVDRTAPGARYRLERSGAAATVAPLRSVRLLGTVVVAGGRSFAMCQLDADPPRVVYPGQRIGAMTLQDVSQGSATFTDNAGVRVMLRVPRAGG